MPYWPCLCGGTGEIVKWEGNRVKPKMNPSVDHACTTGYGTQSSSHGHKVQSRQQTHNSEPVEPTPITSNSVTVHTML